MALAADNIYEREGPTNATPVSGGARVMGTATDVTSARPDASTSTTGIFTGNIVERHAVNLQRIRLAQDASVIVRGIAIEDQFVTVAGAYDTNRALSFAYHGPSRVLCGAAIGRDVLFCSDANGLARAWVDGVDAALSVIGTTKTSCTAVNDMVDVIIERGG